MPAIQDKISSEDLKGQLGPTLDIVVRKQPPASTVSPPRKVPKALDEVDKVLAEVKVYLKLRGGVIYAV